MIRAFQKPICWFKDCCHQWRAGEFRLFYKAKAALDIFLCSDSKYLFHWKANESLTLTSDNKNTPQAVLLITPITLDSTIQSSLKEETFCCRFRPPYRILAYKIKDHTCDKINKKSRFVKYAVICGVFKLMRRLQNYFRHTDEFNIP